MNSITSSFISSKSVIKQTSLERLLLISCNTLFKSAPVLSNLLIKKNVGTLYFLSKFQTVSVCPCTPSTALTMTIA